jgi:large-conductance mechanosensitive channel
VTVDGIAALASRGASWDAAGHYLHWGVVQISLTNFLVIVAMIVLFVIALLAPFPGSRAKDSDSEHPDDSA